MKKERSQKAFKKERDPKGVRSDDSPKRGRPTKPAGLNKTVLHSQLVSFYIKNAMTGAPGYGAFDNIEVIAFSRQLPRIQSMARLMNLYGFSFPPPGRLPPIPSDFKYFYNPTFNWMKFKELHRIELSVEPTFDDSTDPILEDDPVVQESPGVQVVQEPPVVVDHLTELSSWEFGGVIWSSACMPGSRKHATSIVLPVPEMVMHTIPLVDTDMCYIIPDIWSFEEFPYYLPR